MDRFKPVLKCDIFLGLVERPRVLPRRDAQCFQLIKETECKIRRLFSDAILNFLKKKLAERRGTGRRRHFGLTYFLFLKGFKNRVFLCHSFLKKFFFDNITVLA